MHSPSGQSECSHGSFLIRQNSCASIEGFVIIIDGVKIKFISRDRLAQLVEGIAIRLVDTVYKESCPHLLFDLFLVFFLVVVVVVWCNKVKSCSAPSSVSQWHRACAAALIRGGRKGQQCHTNPQQNVISKFTWYLHCRVLIAGISCLRCFCKMKPE